ncbi:MAG TPA: GDP-mannose 4,6-dehydratase [Candidatus Eremiobacteraceae bacterium]|nr:GDP-mannose 4,6-dehydratase [Candidatus Eremiobacteraceae bacterium]
MKAFVTGLDGFAGQWLARELIAAGADVAGGSRVALPSYSILSQTEAGALGWFGFELTDRESVERALAGARPDTVFHLAAQASVSESIADPVATYETNVVGTAMLLESIATVTPDATVVCVGSADAYGPVKPEELPLRETAELRPTNPYAASKTAAESIAMQYARSARLRVIATRSFNHTGPGQRPAFAVPAFAKQIADIAIGSAPPVLRVGNLDARRDLSDVRDVVRAYRLLAERGESGVAYNVCSGSSVSMRSIVDRLVSIAGINVTIEIDPQRLRPSDTPELVGDNSRLCEMTGWTRQIPLEQTLRDVYSWYAAKGTNAR